MIGGVLGMLLVSVFMGASLAFGASDAVPQQSPRSFAPALILSAANHNDIETVDEAAPLPSARNNLENADEVSATIPDADTIEITDSGQQDGTDLSDTNASTNNGTGTGDQTSPTDPLDIGGFGEV